jgi:hypothetical protein
VLPLGEDDTEELEITCMVFNTQSLHTDGQQSRLRDLVATKPIHEKNSYQPSLPAMMQTP